MIDAEFEAEAIEAAVDIGIATMQLRDYDPAYGSPDDIAGRL